jgi:hypothetical protein
VVRGNNIVKRKKEEPMIPIKKLILRGGAREEEGQPLFQKASCLGVQNELSMTI